MQETFQSKEWTFTRNIVTKTYTHSDITEIEHGDITEIKDTNMYS